MRSVTCLPAHFVSKLTDVGDPNACWEWTASKNQKGYGRCRVLGKLLSAHRYCYELLVGPIPATLQIDHLCRNRACCNPAHLEPVTAKINSRRGIAGVVVGSRNLCKTHCPYGHPYNKVNTLVDANGSRQCKTCAYKRNNLRMAARMADPKQADIRRDKKRKAEAARMADPIKKEERLAYLRERRRKQMQDPEKRAAYNKRMREYMASRDRHN